MDVATYSCRILPAIPAGAQLFEELNLVQSLSVSTAVSTGLGESLAADRLLMSEQNSAIFDLALLAPSLISSNSDTEIADLVAPAPDSTLAANSPATGATPVEMPTINVNALVSGTELPLSKTLKVQTDTPASSSADLIDADITRALAALAALEQTGRSSLVLQKARPDLLPSALNARLPVETPKTEATSPAFEASSIPSTVVNFSETIRSGNAETAAALNNLVQPSLHIEPNTMASAKIEDIAIESVSPSQDTESSVRNLTAHIEKLSASDDNSLRAALDNDETPSSVLEQPVAVTKGASDAVTLSTRSDVDSTRLINMPAQADEAAPAVLVLTPKLSTSQTQIEPNPIALVTRQISPEKIPATAVATSVENTPSSRGSVDVFTSQNITPAIEEARRDDRPTFIAELIETPKPIILPNQPMPLAPAAPLADPKPMPQHSALVFANDTRTVPDDRLPQSLVSGAFPAVRLIMDDEAHSLKPTTRLDDSSVFMGATQTLPDDEVVTVALDKMTENNGVLVTHGDKAEMTKETATHAPIVIRQAAQEIISDAKEPTDPIIKSIEKSLSRDKTDDSLNSDQVSVVSSDDPSPIFVSLGINLPISTNKPQQPISATTKEEVSETLSTQIRSTIRKFALLESAHDLRNNHEPSPVVSSVVTTDHSVKADNNQNDPGSPFILDHDAAQFEPNKESDEGRATMSAATHSTINADAMDRVSPTAKPMVENSLPPMMKTPSSEATAFADADTTSDDHHADRQGAQKAPPIFQSPETGDDRSLSAPKAMFEIQTVMDSMTLATSSRPDNNDSVSSMLTESTKVTNGVPATHTSNADTIRDVTLVTRQTEAGDHTLTTVPSFTLAPINSDPHSAFVSAPMMNARETTAAPTYASTENPLFQIQRDRAVEAQVIAALKAGSDEVRLSLYPPQLGQVTINLALDGQKVKVALKTSNREATDLLTAEQPSLSHALHLEGFTLEGFDVTEDDAQNNRKDERDAPIKTQIPASSGSSEFSIDITI